MTEKEFNLTIGIIMGSALPSKEKQELIDSIIALEKKVNSNGWIPCSTELPEEGKDVLVATKYDSIHVAYRMGNKYYIEADEIGDVVAWQPLPEPYEEETEDE